MLKRLFGQAASFLIGFLWAVTVLNGCSGIKTYRNTPDNNLHVQTAADSGSFFFKRARGRRYPSCRHKLCDRL